jgi:peptidoglycan/xylan/chitin deacetylase (PgdA/CDA1 family)
MTERSINLTFHGVGRPHRQLEPGEEDVWVAPALLLSVLDSAKGRDDVLITVDDGNASDVEQVLPALVDRGLTATFFLVAARLGTPSFLDERGVRALAAAGMQIGCHGMKHRAWRGLDDRALYEELVEAKAVLERAVDAPVTVASCPFGSYDRHVLRRLRESGYRHVYTSDRGTARPGDFVQVRNSVRLSDPPGLLARLDAHESRARSVLAHRARLAVKRWR